MEPGNKKPAWLRRRLPGGKGKEAAVYGIISDNALHTVCQEAMCPNQFECYGRGEATFILLGPNCTRRCTFCNIGKAKVASLDLDEPARVAKAVAEMGLKFCVLTMVSRDDLPDGGADHVARTINLIKANNSEVGVEVLISDLGGDAGALERVLAAKPEVLNHNVETVPRLYPAVRPQAKYRRSLELLARVASHDPRPVTKSGIMLGLGESYSEVVEVMKDLRASGCELLTLGQYLAPSDKHYPVVRYVHPDEFDQLCETAKHMGFYGVASAPLVRSSYQAGALYRQAIGNAP